MNDLLLRPALELAALIRSGEISASELVDSCLGRLDRLEPELNAFTHVAHDSAIEAAARIGPGDRRPFAGVPIAVKDNRPVTGMPIPLRARSCMARNLSREREIATDSFRQ